MSDPSVMAQKIGWAIYREYDRLGGELSYADVPELGRIALESLRLPTREMLEAANAAGSPESPALPHEVWPAMIDAAIGKVSD